MFVEEVKWAIKSRNNFKHSSRHFLFYNWMLCYNALVKLCHEVGDDLKE